MGYEILSNYSPDARLRKLLGSMASPVRLNFVGDAEHMSGGLTVFRPVEEWYPAIAQVTHRSERVPRDRKVDIMAYTHSGGLRVGITYHSRAFRPSTVQAFTDYAIDVLARLAAKAAHSEQARGA
jgi:hypothetical protein